MSDITIEKLQAIYVAHEDLMILMTLTNHVSRGDFHDNGSAAGSLFHERLLDHVHGFKKFSHETWVMIARENGKKIVGWCLLTKREHNSQGIRFKQPTADIGFYVRPTHRRQGIASRLVQASHEAAREFGIRRLLVQPWNNSSASFFTALGFKVLTAHVDGWVNGLAFAEVKESA